MCATAPGAIGQQLRFTVNAGGWVVQSADFLSYPDTVPTVSGVKSLGCRNVKPANVTCTHWCAVLFLLVPYLSLASFPHCPCALCSPTQGSVDITIAGTKFVEVRAVNRCSCYLPCVLPGSLSWLYCLPSTAACERAGVLDAVHPEIPHNHAGEPRGPSLPSLAVALYLLPYSRSPVGTSP